MQEPNKKPQDDEMDEQEIMVSCVPLTVLVSGFINSLPVFEYVLKGMEVLVLSVLTYQILGKVLFVGVICSICLVVFIERCMECYDVLCSDNDWDDSDDDSNGSDDDPGFGEHWNNLTKK